MSFGLVAQLLSVELPEGCRSPSHRLLLVVLADHTNDKGHCWPSKRRMAEKLYVSERHVHTILTNLKDSGLLEVVEKRLHRPVVYRIRSELLADLNGTRSEAHDTEVGSTRHRGRKYTTPEVGTPVPPNLPVEPIRNLPVEPMAAVAAGGADSLSSRLQQHYERHKGPTGVTSGDGADSADEAL